MNFKRTAICFSAVMALGLVAFYGLDTRAQAASAPDSMDDGLRAVMNTYALVEKNFADPVTPDRLIYQGAIPGMLSTLDPHSAFLNPSEYADQMRKQRAQYYGVGMLIRMDRDWVTADEPFPGSPAMRAGLRRGDQIIKVDDTDTKGLDTAKVADLLRGPRNTQVRVTVKRECAQEPLTFTVTRGEIQTSQVDGYWLKPGIAYLGVTTFEAQNVGSDVEAVMKQLGESNVKGLVLDLRGNPGGLVTEAVKLAGRFLKDGQVVVSDHGRSAPEQVLRARGVSAAQNYPVVVLVNRGSASASEIVSGALQDHDRAWIMGDSTFGKGLVQAQFPVAEGGALLLVIAHYYTPSGRLIQRDYQNRSFWDYYTHQGDTQPQTDVKSTDSGRKVYGGGGITPDEKWTGPKANTFMARLVRDSAFFHFGSVYFCGRNPQLPSDTWTPDAAVLDQFKAYLTKQGTTFTDEEFNTNRKWLTDQLRFELLERAYDRKTALRAAMHADDEVAQAIDSLPKAEALLNRRGTTQRASR